MFKGAGLVPYTFIKKNGITTMHLLLHLTEDDTYKDFGGKVDIDDKTSFYNACREFSEETNRVLCNVFDIKDDIKYLANNKKYKYKFYTDISYCIYMVKIKYFNSDYIKPYNDEKIIKAVWIPYNKLHKIKLHKRIISTDLPRKLYKLVNNKNI